MLENDLMFRRLNLHGITLILIQMKGHLWPDLKWVVVSLEVWDLVFLKWVAISTKNDKSRNQMPFSSVYVDSLFFSEKITISSSSSKNRLRELHLYLIT